jgi:hypothetical protein
MSMFIPRALVATLFATTLLHADSKKQLEDQRIELLRGLDAEHATARAFIPRSTTPLGFEAATGDWDQKLWEAIGRQSGPAARAGDIVHITKMKIEKNAIILELNNGARGHWYDNAQAGIGGTTQPISQMPNEAPSGTLISVNFYGGIGNVTSAEVKKILAPLLDFNNRSTTEQYVDELPPEIKQAVQDKKAIVGMNRDQVVLAVGRPRLKSRETEDGVEIEDWIYGEPPGRMVFVTFSGQKVSKVKETYAGLGGSVATYPQQ